VWPVVLVITALAAAYAAPRVRRLDVVNVLRDA
jgi:ABC-type lipoprotein release transport system permease subunit